MVSVGFCNFPSLTSFLDVRYGKCEKIHNFKDFLSSVNTIPDDDI